MGPVRGRRRHRRPRPLVALAGVLLVVSLPALARGAPGVTAVPGPVTGLDVRGDTVAIEALPVRVRVVFLADDLFRIWMTPDDTFTDPANSPPERDGAPDSNVVVKHDYPGVTPGSPTPAPTTSCPPARWPCGSTRPTCASPSTGPTTGR